MVCDGRRKSEKSYAVYPMTELQNNPAAIPNPIPSWLRYASAVFLLIAIICGDNPSGVLFTVFFLLSITFIAGAAVLDAWHAIRHKQIIWGLTQKLIVGKKAIALTLVQLLFYLSLVVPVMIYTLAIHFTH